MLAYIIYFYENMLFGEKEQKWWNCFTVWQISLLSDLIEGSWILIAVSLTSP